MCSSWGEILEVNGIFCSPFVKIGALSSFLTFHRLVRSWEIWGQMLCVSKFLQIVLEAQVYFPLSPNPDRDSCRQCHSSSGFEATTQRPPQQTARRLLHAWQRDQEGFPSAADQLCSARVRTMTTWVFLLVLARTPPAWCSPCAHLDANAFPCADPLPAFFERGVAGSYLVLASTWHALNIRYSRWHSPEAVLLLPTHRPSKETHQMTQPLVQECVSGNIISPAQLWARNSWTAFRVVLWSSAVKLTQMHGRLPAFR